MVNTGNSPSCLNAELEFSHTPDEPLSLQWDTESLAANEQYVVIHFIGGVWARKHILHRRTSDKRYLFRGSDWITLAYLLCNVDKNPTKPSTRVFDSIN